MKKMKKRQSGLTRAAIALLGDELPVSLPGEYYIELTGNAGGARALISGVDRLFACTAEEIAVFKKGKCLRIRGEDLTCLTYSGGTLEVKGSIYTVLIGEEDPV